LPPLGRELDGIGDQVPHYLLEPPGVACNKIDSRIDDLLQHDRFSLCPGAYTFDACPHDLGQIDHLHIKPQTSALDAGNVEQIFDQLGLCLRRPFDRCQSSAQIRVEVALGQECRGP
jgi:hypothetical protein